MAGETFDARGKYAHALHSMKKIHTIFTYFHLFLSPLFFLIFYSLEVEIILDSAAAAVHLEAAVYHLLLLEEEEEEEVVLLLDAEEDEVVDEAEDEVKRAAAAKRVALQANLVPRRWTTMATLQWEERHKAKAKAKARLRIGGEN